LGKSFRHAAIATLLTIVACVARAQDAQPRQTFEVAAIKRNTSLNDEGAMRVEGGRFRAVNAPLFWMIAAAYSGPQGPLRPSQIVGAPSWIQAESYDIVAKAADPTEMSNFESRGRCCGRSSRISVISRPAPSRWKS
jgi:hypothetical protein